MQEMGQEGAPSGSASSLTARLGSGFQLLLLTAAASAGAYSRTTMGSLQEVIRDSLALSDTQMALLQGVALAVPMTLIAVPLGLAIDRYSRVRLLGILVALSLLGTVGTALAPQFLSLLMARCMVGFTAFSIPSVAISLIADWYLPSQRGRATMVMALGQIGGVSAGFALGGLLGASPPGDLSGWRWAIGQMAIPFLPVLTALLALREPRRTERVLRNPSTREALAELWRYRAFVAPLLAGVVIDQVATGAALVWAPPTLSRNFNLTTEHIGAVMATVAMVSGIAGAIVGGNLADLCQRTGGPRRTLLALSVLAFLGVPASLFAVMPAVLPASVLLGVLMSVGALISVMATTLSTVVIPNELRGLCTTLISATSLLVGLGLAPLCVSVLSAGLGGSSKIGVALAIVGVVTSLIGALIFALGCRFLSSVRLQFTLQA
jgi:MFS family permease